MEAYRLLQQALPNLLQEPAEIEDHLILDIEDVEDEVLSEKKARTMAQTSCASCCAQDASQVSIARGGRLFRRKGQILR